MPSWELVPRMCEEEQLSNRTASWLRASAEETESGGRGGDLHANGVGEAVVDWSVYDDLASLEHLLLQIDRLRFLLVISLRRARFLALAASTAFQRMRARMARRYDLQDPTLCANKDACKGHEHSHICTHIHENACGLHMHRGWAVEVDAGRRRRCEGRCRYEGPRQHGPSPEIDWSAAAPASLGDKHVFQVGLL